MTEIHYRPREAKALTARTLRISTSTLNRGATAIVKQSMHPRSRDT
jgi:hypothetical protein